MKSTYGISTVSHMLNLDHSLMVLVATSQHLLQEETNGEGGALSRIRSKVLFLSLSVYPLSAVVRRLEMNVTRHSSWSENAPSLD